MSDADNKAVSNVTVTRQPLSLSMCRPNKEAGPQGLSLSLQRDTDMWGRGGINNQFHLVSPIARVFNKLPLVRLNWRME